MRTSLATASGGDWSRNRLDPGNGSFDLIGCVWRSQDGKLLLVVVNYSNTRSQCRLRLPLDDLRNERLRLADRLGEEVYDRDGIELLAPGLFIDHDPWHYELLPIYPVVEAGGTYHRAKET